MPKLPHRLSASLRDRGSDAFARTLKTELGTLGPGALPLDRGITRGGYADDSAVEISVLGVCDDAHGLRAHVGVFFTEILVNCGCGDDPLPMPAYCELRISIDTRTAEAAFEVIAD